MATNQEEEVQKKLSEDEAKEILTNLEEKKEYAEKNQGEEEIRSIWFDIVKHYRTSGCQTRSTIIDKQEELINSKLAVGRYKIERCFELTQCILNAFTESQDDLLIFQRNVDRLEGLIEMCPNWDQRNKQNIYRAIQNMQIREFKNAADLFLNAVSTFCAYEIMDQNTLISYTILVSLISLPRNIIKTKIIKSPEIIQVIKQIPDIQSYLEGYNKCNQRQLFKAYPKVIDFVKKANQIKKHSQHWIRESRIVTYKQMLEPYKSLSLESMANLSGLGVPYLDSELSKFISDGRLDYRIDKVSGLIESNKIDNRDGKYAEIIKAGDSLYNSLQKLTRKVNL